MMSPIKSSSNRNGKIPSYIGRNIALELEKVSACEERILQAIKEPTPENCQIIGQMCGELKMPQQIIDVSRLVGNSPFGMGVSEAAKKRIEIKKAVHRTAHAMSEIFSRLQPRELTTIDSRNSLSEFKNNLHLYHLTLRKVSDTVQLAPSQKPPSLNRIVSMVKESAEVAEELSRIHTSTLSQFDESLYLEANPDVVEGMTKGAFISGFEHYVRFGEKEVSDGQRLLRPIEVVVESDVKSDEQYSVEEVLEIVQHSNIFDEQWYCDKYGRSENPIEAFCRDGIHQGHRPCYYFDPKWYLLNYEDVRETQIPAVVHYIQFGEKEGRNPSQVFDTNWYVSVHGLRAEKGLALAHYLTIGRTSQFSPNKLFDTKYYLEHNTDVREAGIDPAEHCFSAGWMEGRNPSNEFDTRYYIESHFDGDYSRNPLLHYLNMGHKSSISTRDRRKQIGDTAEQSGASNINVSDVTRFFANPGPDFEESESRSKGKPEPKARTIAFYLPQFYAFEENDQWWGKGFTEWRNVMRGSPRFNGHYQPRIPRDLGFYDLNNEATIVEQAELAMKNGIEGFCFYYYWFNGKRLMDKPLDIFANSKKIETPFCIMWANENWTRTWDGLDKEVLINQDYSLEDEDDFIADTLNYFRNEKYITVQGRPLFILYRPNLVPSGKETFARWKSKWKAELGVEPWIMMVQGFGDADPSIYGLDGAVEFPPHKICENLENINSDLEVIDKNFKGHVVSYDDVIKRSLSESAPKYPLIKTVSPHWDNDARREGRGFVMHGSTPAKYESWLSGAVEYSRKNTFEGESFVFVNAWNEWAEGAYLEPDVHYGHAYLNATRRAVFGEDNHSQKKSILLVGHDAWPHGAQMLLLNMAKTFSMQFGMRVLIVLQKSGSLLDQYEQYGAVKVLERDGEENVVAAIEKGRFGHAITNTSVAGDVVPLLKDLDINVVSLIHELPRLITEYGLEDSVKKIAKCSDHVVFPAEFVQKGFAEKAGVVQGEALVRPQGIYKNFEYNANAKKKVCEELGIPADSKLIINVGYADLRKGFDIFLNIAGQMASDKKHVHFLWVGGMAPDMERWVFSDLAEQELLSNFHSIGYTDRVEDYFSACDCLFLSSREDPYPSVVLEAMSVGKPVVLFENATGLDNVVEKHGLIVDRNDNQKIISALTKSINTSSDLLFRERSEYVKEHYQFDEYCFDLLMLLRPDIKKVSVVVPNYNYSEYIESRLESVADQSYPIFETIVLDDCSTDSSVETIKSYLRRSGHMAKFVPNETNSGNTFRQWDNGLKHVRGDYLWIAEADDLADNRFIADSINEFSADTVLTFSDSKQIDTDGELTAESYSYYYNTISKSLFGGSFSMPGREFVLQGMSTKNPIMNVSSAVWRAEALRKALDMTKDEVVSRKLVGDWRLYIETLTQSDAVVSYINKPLNTHRRHASSVTHSLDNQLHLEEIKSIHKHLANTQTLDQSLIDSMNEYIEELEKQFGIDKEARKVA